MTFGNAAPKAAAPKTTTWYRVQNYETSIGEFTVERFTDASIWWIDHEGQARHAKRVSSYDCFFPTREQAVTHIRERIGRDIEKYKEYLREAEAQLAELK